MTRPLRILSLFDRSGHWASGAPEGSEIYTVDLVGEYGLREVRGRKMWHIATDIRHADLVGDRVDVILAAPPCQGLGKQGKQAQSEGRATMTEDDGLQLAQAALDLVRRLRPRVWCFENPQWSRLWRQCSERGLVERQQVVLLGWWGYPAKKATGLGGDFEPVPIPFPLPEIDVTDNGKRPGALKPKRGGVASMSSSNPLRSETPGPFADAWWAANLPRLTQE